MTTEVDQALALKEWAAVIDALLTGRQLITLRKGGIREKSFLVQGRSFYLLPTFEHQAPELIKPQFRGDLDGAIAAQRSERGPIIRAHAELAGCWEIDDAERLTALAPYHIFSEDYVRSRFNWRPKQPLTVLLLRARPLATPWQTDLPPGAGGCRSWLPLDASSAPALAQPRLDDAAFAAAVAPLSRLLG